MKTKHEESSAISRTGRISSPKLPIMTASNPPQAPKSEVHCLQDLGDLRQLFSLYSRIPLSTSCYDYTIQSLLDKALDHVVQETRFWARQHKADGRYRDAEFLFRRVSFDKNDLPMNMEPYADKDVMPTLVSIYEKLGDYPAAEMAQETLLRQLFPKTRDPTTGDLNLTVSTYAKMLSDFRKRILDIGSRLQIPVQTYIDWFIVYRIAILDIPPLNEVSLERGLFNLEPTEDHQCTLLHIAAQENAINLARLLIEKGVRIDSRDPQSCTPLHIAAECAGPAMVELLLANFADVAAVDEFMRTPLHAAVTGKSAEQIIALLISAKVQREANDNLRRTALMVAIQDDLPAVARFLVQRGANLEKSDELAEPPLLLAVGYKREWAVKFLLENDASLVERNAQGDTALYLATKMAQMSIVQILLDYGAMTKTTVDQQSATYNTCLCRAVKDANMNIVNMLLHAGADISARNYLRETVLHQAAREGTDSHEDIAHLLLTRCAPLDTANTSGDTVFHLAVGYKRLNMIAILIEHTKPYELHTVCGMRNNYGRTPLELAAFLAKDTEISSEETSILQMMEFALGLRPSTEIPKFFRSPTFSRKDSAMSPQSSGVVPPPCFV